MKFIGIKTNNVTRGINSCSNHTFCKSPLYIIISRPKPSFWPGDGRRSLYKYPHCVEIIYLMMGYFSTGLLRCTKYWFHRINRLNSVDVTHITV